MDGYIPQSPAEKQYFDYLWDIANNRPPSSDPSGLGELSGSMAVQFFQRSTVDRGFLKNIWSLSTPSATMNLHQFYTALRFITMIQNGEIPISKERLQSTTKENLGLPRFTGIDLPAPPKHAPVPTSVSVAPTAVPVAAVPHPPGVPPIHGHAPHAHAMPPFAMTPQEHVKYHSLFVSYDSNRDGFLSKEEALPIYQKSGMDMARVEMIYAMVDEDRDGLLTSKKFCAAFHIIVCVTKRNHAMPPTLPPALHHFLVNAPVVPPTHGVVPPVAPATPAIVAVVPPVASIATVPVPVPAHQMPVTPVTPAAALVTPVSVPDAFGDMAIPPAAAVAAAIVPSTNYTEEQPHHDSSFDAFDDHPATSTTTTPSAANAVPPPTSTPVTTSNITMDILPPATQPVNDAFAAFDAHVPAHTAFKMTVEPVVPQKQEDHSHDAFSSFSTLDAPPASSIPAAFPTMNSTNQIEDHAFSAFEAIPTATTAAKTATDSNNTTSLLRIVQQSVAETQQQQLRHMQEWHQELTQESSFLQDTVSQMQEENEALRQQLQETAQAVQNLMVEVKSKRQLLVSVVQERSSLQREVSDAEAQRLQLQQEVDSMSTQLTSLSSNTAFSSTAGANSKEEEAYLHAYSTLLQDTRVAQPRLLQLLQQDIAFLQTCKQSFTKQVEALKCSSATTQEEQVKRLEVERDRQTQALQRLQQEQQATIERLQREKQVLIQQLQSSHERDAPRDTSLLQEKDQTEEVSIDFDKAYPVDNNDFESHFQLTTDSSVITNNVASDKESGEDKKSKHEEGSEGGVFDTHDTDQENDSADMDAFGYAAFPEPVDEKGDVFPSETAFDVNDPFANTDTNTNNADTNAAVSEATEEDPFAGFSNNHKETEKETKPDDFGFEAKSELFFSDNNTITSTITPKDKENETGFVAQESIPEEKDPFFNGGRATTNEFDTDPFGEAAVSSFPTADVQNSGNNDETNNDVKNEDPFAADFESDPFGSSGGVDKVGEAAVTSGDPFASTGKEAVKIEAKEETKVEGKVETCEETTAKEEEQEQEDLFASNSKKDDKNTTDAGVADDEFGSFATNTAATANSTADGFDDFDAFGSEMAGVVITGGSTASAAIDISFTLDADPFGLPTPSTAVSGQEKNDLFFASSSEKNDSNNDINNDNKAIGEEDPFASFD